MIFLGIRRFVARLVHQNTRTLIISNHYNNNKKFNVVKIEIRMFVFRKQRPEDIISMFFRMRILKELRKGMFVYMFRKHEVISYI